MMKSEAENARLETVLKIAGKGGGAGEIQNNRDRSRSVHDDRNFCAVSDRNG